MFADLHNHPLSRSFNTYRNSPVELNNDGSFHGWNIPASNLRIAGIGKRSFPYTQCDLARLSKSKTRLVFASLYPTEKGFLIGKTDITKQFASIPDEKKRLESIRKAVKEKAEWQTLRDFLQAKKMGMSLFRINSMQGDSYDYFNELQQEYAFYLKMNGVDFSLKQFQLQENVTEDISGRYELASKGSDLPNILGDDPTANNIAMVLTIEGMHALGVGNPSGHGVDVSMELLKERIKSIKGEHGVGWKYPVFFITFSHHFSNTLCGHAHSIPGDGKFFMNQEADMNKGFLNNGLEIAKELLGLTTDLQGNGARRILIDVKHMSAQGRLEYYNSIIKPYNRQNPGTKIPIIASHVGYSGGQTLQELIDNSPNERNNTAKDGFLYWNINLCDEDIAEVHDSGGLIGMSFDQRVMGLEKTFLSILKIPKKKINNISGFLRMLECVVSVPYKRRLANPDLIWNAITIGSDYDGFIDPVDSYPTVLSLDSFKRDLLAGLETWRKDSRAALLANVDTAVVVEKLCYQNAYDFTVKHFV
ncbi:hypothetical protein ACW9KT_19630 [Hymenobacter sp. HD11105]